MSEFHETEIRQVTINCLINTPGKEATNQQTCAPPEPLLNYIYLRVGNRNYKEGIEYYVTTAIVMKTLQGAVNNKAKLGNEYDIGFLFPRRNCRKWKKLGLASLTLPSK